MPDPRGPSTVSAAVREVRPLLAARGFAVPDRPGLRLRALEDVFAYAEAEGVDLRIDGKVKAEVDEGYRGLASEFPRLLSVGPVRDPAAGHKVIVDERYVTPGRDWASVYTKLRCPDGHFLTGYSVHGRRRLRRRVRRRPARLDRRHEQSPCPAKRPPRRNPPPPRCCSGSSPGPPCSRGSGPASSAADRWSTCSTARPNWRIPSAEPRAGTPGGSARG
ncbi:hypothetical protein GCM10010307_26220 [Streptomyces vastus]|uniref:Uncharacterized protein n=1 Tax=Streptomyces vastus TaxID=285451 RepID=A0ABN3QQH3_9ACTN